MDAEAAAGSLGTQLADLGTPERAESDRAYLKSALVHYGTSVPKMRAVANAFLREHPGLTHDDLVAVVRALWDEPVYEHRACAVLLLVGRQRLLTADDLELVEQMLRESKTWALVDEIARHVVAGLAAQDPTVLDTLDQWVTDDDFWIRRSAVLGLSRLLRKGRELPRLFRYADQLLPEREFFIRKVIGWMIREVGQRHPDEVSLWLRRNMAAMNGVTIREAVKYLPDGDELIEAYRTRR